MDGNVFMSLQTILETYFIYLGQHHYDKAKDIVEKERDHRLFAKTYQGSTVVSSFLTACSQLAICEKNYMQTTFLVPKSFLTRKDCNLKVAYENVRNEFKRIKDRSGEAEVSASTESMAAAASQTQCFERAMSICGTVPPASLSASFSLSQSPTSTSSTSSNTSSFVVLSQTSNQSVMAATTSSPTPPTVSTVTTSSFGSNRSNTVDKSLDIIETFTGHICEQLFYYIVCRIEFMHIYEEINSCSTVKFLNLETIGNAIEAIVRSSQKHFHHPLLSPIKNCFTYEIESLLALINAHREIQNFQFMSSLFKLHDAHIKLGAWLSSSSNKDSPRRSSQGLQRAPPLLQWLYKIKSHLLAKFSFYFHSILSKQTTNHEMKNFLSKQSTDHYSKLVSFQRKTDASCLLLIYDTHNGKDHPGISYQLPFTDLQPIIGLSTFPVMFIYPSEKVVQNHLPSIIMIMNQRVKELNTTDNIVYVHDERMPTTFFLLRPDPRVTLVIIFEGKKVEKDSYIINFLQEIYFSLRGNKIFSALKLGTK